MQDIKTQWNKPIYTKTLRESPIAYKTFRIRCLHPTWTNRQLAENTNQSINTVEGWSRKYHHKSRLQAYLQECYDEIQKQTLEIIQTDLQEYLHRQKDIHQILNNDLEDLQRQQSKLGTQATKEQKKTYQEDKDSYFKNTKDHYTTTQLVLRNTKENINPDRYNTDDIPEGAKQFIQILQKGRQQDDE